MWEAAVAIGSLLLFAVFITSFCSIMNRRYIESTKTAEDFVRRSLINKVGCHNMDMFLRDALPNEALQQGRFLLHRIAEILEVPAESLLFDGILKEHLVARNITTPMGECVTISPFECDIDYVLCRHVDWKQFQEKIDALHIPIKSGDDSFHDFFMGMTMREFVAFFAPLTTRNIKPIVYKQEHCYQAT